MTKQFHINVADRDNVVIDVKDDESFSIKIDQPPTKFFKDTEEVRKPYIQVDGLRWRNDDHFHLGWFESELNIDDKITIQILESNEDASQLTKEEKYFPPEKECSFCDKKSSEVKYLIEGNCYNYICEECVDKAQEIINDMGIKVKEGPLFDIISERIRKIEEKALRKLRKPKDDPGKDPDGTDSWPESDEEKEYEQSIPELPEELVRELEKDLCGELHVLEIHNDDITSMTYVVKIIQKFSTRKNKQQACELMLKIHNSGNAQLLAGEKDVLDAVMKHIVNDARSRKFPLKLNVVKA